MANFSLLLLVAVLKRRFNNKKLFKKYKTIIDFSVFILKSYINFLVFMQNYIVLKICSKIAYKIQ